MMSPSALRDRSRRLCRDQTEAESKLWSRLRNRQLGGMKFRRHHFINPFIVDFCCPEKWLVIELDGGQHAEQVKADQERTAFLESKGYQVLRFWNNEIFVNMEAILEKIAAMLSDPHPNPLPSREREHR
jgi:very-short-patch-repair endonuclease